MSYETDWLHRHGWRLAGSEMRNCKKTPLWKKPGVIGMKSTTEAVEYQRQFERPGPRSKERSLSEAIVNGAL